MNTNFEYLQQEGKTLDAIRSHMKKRIRSKVKYKSKPKEAQTQEEPQSLILEKQIENFEEICINNFLNEMGTLFLEPTEPIEPSESINSGDPLAFWIDSIDILKWACENAIEESGFPEDMSQKTNDLCDKLVNQLPKEQKAVTFWEKLVFGRNYFKNLKYLLDLRNKEIRILLPYLLTAYTCNSGNNSFLSRTEPEALINILTSSSNIE